MSNTKLSDDVVVFSQADINRAYRAAQILQAVTLSGVIVRGLSKVVGGFKAVFGSHDGGNELAA